jgi:hypothetical protein
MDHKGFLKEPAFMLSATAYSFDDSGANVLSAVKFCHKDLI